MTFNPRFPSFPTLSDCIAKARALTASSNTFQVTDTYIVKQMQSFYLYDLPAKFRTFKLQDKYTFDTTKGVNTYFFNSELYTTVQQPCYCAKRELKFFTDPWQFYGINYNWQQIEQFAVGDGSEGPYSGQTQASPILASVNNDPGYSVFPNLYFPQSRSQNILISANSGYQSTENVTDDGKGNLIYIQTNTDTGQKEYGYFYSRIYATTSPYVSPGEAIIDYETGTITDLYFQNPIPSGAPIKISYNPVVLGKPLAILFFQNQFTLTPTPDTGYTIELVAYRQPIQAIFTDTKTGNPELSEWWEILAVGASKKIFEDRMDDDGVSYIDKMLKELYDILETRTAADIGKKSIKTLYTDQLTHNYSTGGWGGPFA